MLFGIVQLCLYKYNMKRFSEKESDLKPTSYVSQVYMINTPQKQVRFLKLLKGFGAEYD
jgi:hypothetical protein